MKTRMTWVLIAATSLGVAIPTHAATSQWWDPGIAGGINGGNGTWDTNASNWASSAAGTNAPGKWTDGNDAFFAAADTVSTVAVANVNVGSLSLTGSKSVTFLDGGVGSMTLNNGMTNTGAVAVFNNGIVLGSNQTWYLTQSTTVTGLVNGAACAFTKDGSGTLTLSNNFLTTGPFTLAAGTVQSMNGAVTTPFGTGSLTINSGTLSLLPQGTGVAAAMNGVNAAVGSTLTYTTNAFFDLARGNWSSNSYTAGNAGATANSVLVRGGDGVMQIHVTASGDLGAAEKFIVNGGVATNNGIVSASIVGLYGSAAGSPADFLTYDTVNGLKVVTYDAVKTNIASDTTFASDLAVAAMKVRTAMVTVTNGVTVTVTNGADAGLIIDNGSANLPTISGNGTLNFGNSKPTIYVRAYSNRSGLLGVNLAGTAPMTKFGPGTLILSNQTLWANSMTIQSGNLTLWPTLDMVYSNSIGGPGTLTKDGAKNLTLTGNNVISLGTASVGGITGGGTLTISGGVFSNQAPGGPYLFGSGSVGNALILTNNARFFESSAPTYYADGCTVLVTGTGTVWNMLGGDNLLFASNDKLIITDGGVVTNFARFRNGGNQTSIIVSNGGQFVTTGNNSRMGYNTYGNTLWIGGTNASTGAASLFSTKGGQLVVGDSGPGGTNNSVIVAGGGILTNVNLILPNGSPAAGPFNSLIVTNGGKAFTIAASVGNTDSNTVWVGGIDPVTGTPSMWSMGLTVLNLGAAKVGNSVIVTAGGVVTNVTQIFVGSQYYGGQFNSLIISNGGTVASSGGSYIGYANTGGPNAVNGNRAVVTGTNSIWNALSQNLTIGYVSTTGTTGTWNRLQVDLGGVLTNVGTLTVGQAVNPGFSVSNSLTIGANGSVFATAVSAGVNCTGGMNVASVLAGGLLEANALTCGAPGNLITNAGGIYQFANAAPTITPNGAGSISLADGTLSFRAVTNANVVIAGTSLTNIAWSGSNGFRLTAASNTTASSQTYVFEPGVSATNYARLEMVGGATCYRGQSSNSLTIGQAPGSSASMLCSNTAAVVAIPFTNNGTLRIVNSTLTFTTNATLNGTVIVDLNSLLNTNAVLIAQRDLTLGGTLQFINTPTTNRTLMTYSGTRNGKFQITGLPCNYSVSYPNGAVTLNRTPPGTALFMF